jgi:esterase/lipase
MKQKTEYAIVYLPGFTASYAEAEPVHRNIAREFGCNLYLARLAEHGIDTTDALINLKAEKYWESAEEALAIGKQLGNKVILMGTSTGGTFALMLASQFPEVNSLILLSPNIAINDPFAFLLNNPWGLQIAHAVLQSDYITSKDQRPIYKQYWSAPYRVEAAVQLQEILESSMTTVTFSQVKQPVISLYYYKDKVHQDSVVKVSAIKEMMKQLGTSENLKRAVNIPGAGNHVIGSYIKSKDLESVQYEIEKFMIEVLKITPIRGINKSVAAN